MYYHANLSKWTATFTLSKGPQKNDGTHGARRIVGHNNSLGTLMASAGVPVQQNDIHSDPPGRP